MEWVCTSPDLEGVSGKYLDSRCAGNPNGGFGSSEESKDMEKARRLWNVSCDLTGLYEFKTD
ncbi:hypothetical protein HK104_000377 [Borealophlyctis nickersoniae]|nr:hypothetical protein HK104_000377 [Borealophlyctis nickersoniae]